MELSPNTRQLEFEEVISNKSAFDLFAVHLVGEFSIENLAFLLEAMQIKQDLVDGKLCSQNEVGLVVPMAPERMERTRRRKKSEQYTVQDLRENVKYLMQQYVQRCARCGVNLSSMTRDRSLEIFDKLEHQSEQQIVVQTTCGTVCAVDGEGSNGDIDDNAVVMRNLEFFVSHNSDEPSQLERELSVQYALLLDKAIEEIICLLRSDCLVRFRRSKAYSKLNRDPPL